MIEFDVFREVLFEVIGWNGFPKTLGNATFREEGGGQGISGDWRGPVGEIRKKGGEESQRAGWRAFLQWMGNLTMTSSLVIAKRTISIERLGNKAAEISRESGCDERQPGNKTTNGAGSKRIKLQVMLDQRNAGIRERKQNTRKRG